MFIFIHKSQCASMIVPSSYVPRSEIPWWEGLDSFNKVLPNCSPERAIYSPTSRIWKGLVFVIYKGTLEKFQSRQTGTGISLSWWLTQDHQPGIVWNSIKYNTEGIPTLLTCLVTPSCVISGWAWGVLCRKDRHIWFFSSAGVGVPGRCLLWWQHLPLWNIPITRGQTPGPPLCNCET